MFLYTFKKSLYIYLITILITSCASEESAEIDTKDKTISIITVPSDTQSKVATNIGLISIAFSGSIHGESLHHDSIEFTPAIHFTLDKSLINSRNIAFLTVHDYLAPNTIYRAKIKGLIDKSGHPIPDNDWLFTTFGVIDEIAPTKPENLLTFGQIKSNSVTLMWGAATDNNEIAGYRVVRNGSIISITSNTSYTDTSVTENTSYQYKVIALDLASNTTDSDVLQVSTPSTPISVDNTAPSKPTITGSATTTSATINWQAASDNIAVTGYRIVRNSTVIATVASSARNYTNSGLSSNTNFSYQVEAFDAAGNRNISTALAISTLEAADNINPSTPGNLTENSKTTNSATFSWSASTDNVAVTGYRILRNSTVIATISASTTSYSNTGLSANTAYQYQVEAFDAAGNTAITNNLSISTAAIADSTNPSVPGNLTETSKTNSLAAFSWSASIDNVAVTGYRIFRNSQLITSLSSATTSYTNTGLSASTTYQFQVEAFDAAGNAARSTNLSVTTLVAPSITCTSTINPGQSFISAFSTLLSGDTLCLNDGTYNQAMDIPSNINVRAVNDGMAEIDGLSLYGEEWTGGLVQMKGTNSSVRGLRVHHASTNANACYMAGTNNTMQVMSCSHAGAQKHKNPVFMTGSGHLLEDSWAFGKGRYVVQCFKGSNMTLRHNVARWDIATPNTPTEPNAGFSIYNCNGMTVENNISLDYGLSSQDMRFGADFYAPHNVGEWPDNNNNHYLGNYAINHALGNSNRKGMMFDGGNGIALNNVIKDFYVNKSNIGVVIPSYVTDLVMDNCTFLNIDINNIIGGSQNNIGVCDGTSSTGAVYVNRVKVSNNLFPWKNEALIKADMCRSGERQSDWCATNLSLSDYIATF